MNDYPWGYREHRTNPGLWAFAVLALIALAIKFWVLVLIAIAVFFAVRELLRRHRLVTARNARLAANADYEHAALMAGDLHTGVYGHFQPAPDKEVEALRKIYQMPRRSVAAGDYGEPLDEYRKRKGLEWLSWMNKEN